jgi:hypothetical protein
LAVRGSARKGDRRFLVRQEALIRCLLIKGGVMTKVDTIIEQRALCECILYANLMRTILLTDLEVQIVRKMKKSDKPLKDWHLAILKAFVERAK